MRIIFMGSAELSCPSLTALADDNTVTVVTVVTQPDRPKGRKLKLSRSPVRVLAEERAIPVLTPEKVGEPDSAQALEKLRPDLVVVVAYGQILSQRVLDSAPQGCVNVHASLLPKYRGAAPIQWAIVNGEKVTGATTMFMDAGMDTGDIVYQKEVPIALDDTAGSLSDKLAEEGAALLVKTLSAFREGTPPRRPQNRAEASYAPKLKKQDGRIDWTQSARDIYNRVRGFNPWPCCWCEAPAIGRSSSKSGPARDGRRLKILKAREEDATGQPGMILDVSGEGPVVATGSGAVRLLEIQPEGGRIMRGDAYARGRAMTAGQVFQNAEREP